MKNIKTIVSAGAIFLSVCIASPVRSQEATKECEKSKVIPADVTAILERSCTGCHSEDGNTLAKSHFNYTKWNEYSVEEKTSIGKDMVKILAKDKMPPKKFLKNYPDLKLTAAEKKTVSNWAGQL